MSANSPKQVRSIRRRRVGARARKIVAGVALALAAGYTPAAMGVDAVWVGGTGDWSLDTNWSPVGVPNGLTFDVKIDNGDGGTGSVVTLDTTVSINSLVLDLGDALSFTNGRDLAVSGVDGDVTNNGTISLNSTGSLTQFTVGGDLLGSGEVVIGTNSFNEFRTSGILTHGADHTIRGAGKVLAGSGGMNNNGTIIADQTVIMTVDPSALGIINAATGTFRASGSGGMEFLGGLYGNQFGTIEVLAGSKLELEQNVTINGGTLDTFGDGVVLLNGSGTAQKLINVTTTGDGTDDFVQTNGKDAAIQIGLTNNASWHLNSTSSLTDLTFADGNANQTLDGTGRIVMNGHVNNRILLGDSTLTVTQGADHTIHGGGSLLADTGGMINNGTILADLASDPLTVDPDVNGFTNNGTMEATGAAGLVLNGGDYTNTTTIEAKTGSKVDLLGGVTMTGGTLKSSGTGAVNLKGSVTNLVLDSVTLEGTTVQPNGNDSAVMTTVVNDGTWTLNSTSGQTDVTFLDGASLDGTGELVLMDHVNNRILTNDTVMTQAADHTIRGGGSLLADSGGMINNGTITADGGIAITVNPNDNGFTNNGVMEATSTDGLILSGGDYTNTTTIEAKTGSKVDLLGGVTMAGGTLKSSGTGVVNLKGSVTNLVLDSVMLEGNTVQLNANDSAVMTTVVNDGTWTLNSTSGQTDVTFLDGASLDGTGELLLMDHLNNRIMTNDTVMTQAVDHTIRGGGSLLVNSGGMINNGTITADGGMAITVDPNDNGFTNNGVMEATSTDGLILSGGDYTNTTTIEAKTGSKVDLLGGVTMTGGTLKSSGTGVVNLKGSVTNLVLDGVTLEGNTVQPNANDSAIMTTVQNNGVWELSSSSSVTTVTFQDGAILDGTGELVLMDHINNHVLTNGTVMTQAADHTIRGGGSLLANSGGMLNQGTIRADEATRIEIDPDALGFTNEGLMEAIGAGGLEFQGGAFTNAAGGTIAVTSKVTLTTSGTTLTNEPGGLVEGTGTLDADGTGVSFINGGTVAPGFSPGELTIEGVYNQTATGLLDLEIGGTPASNLFDLLTVSDVANLDGNIIVNLINGFTPLLTDQYTVLTATNGVSGFFANADPGVGTTATVNLGGGSSFDVIYNANSVVLTNVNIIPEPASLAIFTVGGALLLPRRRTR